MIRRSNLVAALVCALVTPVFFAQTTVAPPVSGPPTVVPQTPVVVAPPVAAPQLPVPPPQPTVPPHQ